jgi:hypothetical protein
MPTPQFPDAPKGGPPQIWNIQDFGGINTKSKRPAISDNEFAWLQNYFPIGPGNMRTLWSNGAVIYTAPLGKTIIYYYFFNLATVQQCAVFLSDGTAVQVNPVTGATVTISAVSNFFYNGGYLPASVQWNASGIVIVCEAQNPQGLFAWDGSTLYVPGVFAPSWLTNQTSGTVMPTGIHGNAVEVYQNRLWVTAPPSAGVPATLSQSAPSNGANFNSSSGGGTAPQQDSSLRATFTALKQANGFLYYWGDSSIGVISNVQTSGSTTTYNNQNVDPQIGTSWPSTVQAFSGTQFGTGIIFANPQGVFLLVGGTVQKISDALDGLFADADFDSLTPTASAAIIFGIKVYCLLIKTLDQNGDSTQVMCMWDGRKWFLGSQDRTLDLIGTNEANSDIQTWGCDGDNLFQCFTAASATLAKSLQSKFFAGQSNAEYITFKKLYRFYFQAVDNAGSGIVFSGTFDSDFANTAMVVSSLIAMNVSNEALQAQNIANQNLYPVSFGVIAAGNGSITFVNVSGLAIYFTNNSGGVIVFTVQTLVVPMIDAACYGRLIGTTLGSLSTDFTLIALTMLYSFDAPYGG